VAEADTAAPLARVISRLTMSASDDESRDLGPVGRRVPLPQGKFLAVRLMESRDVDGVAALYADLDDESRYRRFFSLHRPDRSFFERMARLSGEGGAELVAVIGAGGSEEIVGEAGYVPLPNGDGELAITLDRRWRGWLGAYLLDALVEVAAARGVPNLEADILMVNRPMLALAQSRGCANVPNSDWSVTRVMIGATTRSPSWPGPEGAGGHWHAQDAALSAGMDVLACPGPRGPRRRCPVLDGYPCPLAAEADVIVVDRRGDTDEWHAVRTAHPRLHAGVPVCVETRRDDPVAPGERRVPASDERGAVSFLEHVARPRSTAAPAARKDPST
jgi:RimJ/RimL family protein N-acetyltransferase